MTSIILNEDEKSKKTQDVPESFAEKFLKTRQIILSGEVNKELAEKIVKQLFIMEADSSEKPVYIYIDSPGGDVDSGFAIFDAIRFISCPVYIVGIGLIASAAALILLSVPKENRFGFENSRYLIHQPLSEMRGVATDVEIYAKEMENTRLVINKVISEQTGQSLEKVTQDTERDYWLSSLQACEYGLISKIVKNRKDLKK
ncbi:MAG: ATP-dependent Clp protease proteolytic subunit [Spirochaetia bacterium]|nr:ATP-dependent Clp protease proteolytic subunit [Spirochaetia bacterium]MDD5776044.1 ATP-dependent Clp protease proteolytic subunit [Treponema sp.]MCI5608398.1 ATP-dependent Clp protease proteolytic subunit [Spirochaetia bacterium]MCI7108622.1 ATP-dependent Clp protease proteolytic subunit [Spirochaetia bacterium]MCI7564739.1 ATP-dependent Clp protease proteolytic subunit [Spirochaetia bacterium]